MMNLHLNAKVLVIFFKTILRTDLWELVLERHSFSVFRYFSVTRFYFF